MAPRPKPTALRILNGNPSGRPLNDREPTPKPGKPRVPDHVRQNPEAYREWKRTSDSLEEMGLLSTADRAALAAYCIAWSRWVEAEEQLRKFGLVIKSSNGYPVTSPYLSIARETMSQMTRLLAEFGLTPSSRTRVHVTKPPAGSDFDQWERGEGNG